MSLFKKRVYLDYAAATPLRPEACQAMERYFSREFANPSAIYGEGREARRALEDARTRIARVAHAGVKDVIFTSGGTEADNLAIFGAVEEAKRDARAPHVIVTEHEHPAILEAARKLGDWGIELSVVPVGEVAQNIRENTVLISLSLCNSETGELYPVSKIGRAVREARKKGEKSYPLLHVDASQGAVTQHINVDTLQADLLTLDAGKVYGPKGAGALIVRPWARIAPRIVGGGQERGLRSGTENVGACVGFAIALELVDRERETIVPKFEALRKLFIDLMQKELPNAIVNGGEAVPNIVSITIPGTLHEYLAIALAEKGVLVSTGSSCSSRKSAPEKEALRFSLGRETGESDIRAAVRALREILLY